MKITTKAEFNALSQAGLLGNFLRTWKYVDDIPSDVPWLTIQSTVPASPNFIPVVSQFSLTRELDKLRLSGVPEETVYFREIPDPAATRVANIEVMLDDRCGMYLHIEPDTLNPVRGIRDRTKPVYGAAARVILKAVIGEESYETLYDLWEHYPTAVIEATHFSRSCGRLDKNLVIWEVRDF